MVPEGVRRLILRAADGRAFFAGAFERIAAPSTQKSNPSGGESRVKIRVFSRANAAMRDACGIAGACAKKTATIASKRFALPYASC
ncbi:hypothetical protein [Luteimonas aquatica]|uniref:hypothetical protein n=1 Tax=Luteimonas aquatica TaxID=450364 RepID=UPI001F5A3029|nr:hypothetical protein [Luteimonas aquatica]